MKNRAPISKKYKDSMLIVVIGIIAALVFSILDGDIENPSRMLGGVIMGAMGSGFIVLFEIWFPKPIFRELKFSSLVIYKSIIYSSLWVVIIVLVVSIGRSNEEEMSIVNYWASDTFYSTMKADLLIMIVYSLTATLLFVLVYQLSKKMGQGILLNFISGKYHHAREEERIFMFMDLNKSTVLAEKLGDIEYNKLLNAFFSDITESILANYGEIYRYVGDEVVVSWTMKRGLKNSHFIRTFFQASQAIHKKKEQYLDAFGLVPSFSAAFNYGKVIIGEVGEVKSQISFLGNVLYQTPEIEKGCKKFSSTNLIPEELLNKVDLPMIYSAKKEGLLDISGQEAIIVYSIEEK